MNGAKRSASNRAVDGSVYRGDRMRFEIEMAQVRMAELERQMRAKLKMIEAMEAEANCAR